MQKAKLNKTTAHRLLAGLAAYGLADQHPETGRYFVGLKLLSLRSAAEVPATDVGDGDLAGWVLTTDDDGRPLCWRPASGDGRETPVEAVGPKGSMRDLIDSAVASPARAAVRVDEDGKLVGAVPFSTLTEHLPAPQEITAEPQEAR